MVMSMTTTMTMVMITKMTMAAMCSGEREGHASNYSASPALGNLT